jgi:hypothetical protein
VFESFRSCQTLNTVGEVLKVYGSIEHLRDASNPLESLTLVSGNLRQRMAGTGILCVKYLWSGRWGYDLNFSKRGFFSESRFLTGFSFAHFR